MSPRGKLARSLLSTSHLHHQKHYTPSYRFLSSQSVLPKARPIPISEAPSLDYFRDHILSADRPHLLRSTISSWSALQKWKDVRGLKREKAASLVIPVEVAKIPYTAEAAPGYNAQESDQWSRVEMPYDVFLDAFMAPETEVAKVVSQAGEKLKDPRTLARSDSYRDRWVGYMAQFPLLDEVPSLKADAQPRLEYLQAGRGDQYSTNVWIGTGGTFTPVHSDPYHNLFCQIVGTKHIRVFTPSAAEKLYIKTDPLQRNTSSMMSHNPDTAVYPLYHEALKSSWEVTVQPGEVLFIPKNFWHSVRSLEKSVSVNSWFL